MNEEYATKGLITSILQVSVVYPTSIHWDQGEEEKEPG